MLNNHLKQSIIYVLGIWKSLKEQTKEEIIDEFSRVFFFAQIYTIFRENLLPFCVMKNDVCQC